MIFLLCDGFRNVGRRRAGSGTAPRLVQAISRSPTAAFSVGSKRIRLKFSASHMPSIASRTMVAKIGSSVVLDQFLVAGALRRTGSSRSGKLASAAVMAPLARSNSSPVSGGSPMVART